MNYKITHTDGIAYFEIPFGDGGVILIPCQGRDKITYVEVMQEITEHTVQVN